jgi:hypothetical protein
MSIIIVRFEQNWNISRRIGKINLLSNSAAVHADKQVMKDQIGVLS